MRHLVLYLSLALGAAACQQSTGPGESAMAPVGAPATSAQSRPDLRPERASLIAAGNEVSADSGQGLREASAGPSRRRPAAIPRVATIEGRDAARELPLQPPDGPARLAWQVIVADVSNDARRVTPGRRAPHHGSRRPAPGAPRHLPHLLAPQAAAGGWGIAAFVFNQGGPRPCRSRTASARPTKKQRPQLPQHRRPELRQAVRAADAAFSALSVGNGSGPAFERYAAPNAIAVRGGSSSSGRRPSARPSPAARTTW